jgi:hypothetical protein
MSLCSPDAKVRAGCAVNPVMNSHSLESIAALSEAIAAIRHARGLKNPDDLLTGTPEWKAASDAFADDFVRALDGEPTVRAWWAF